MKASRDWRFYFGMRADSAEPAFLFHMKLNRRNLSKNYDVCLQ